jgi:hypothetical protein
MRRQSPPGSAGDFWDAIVVFEVEIVYRRIGFADLVNPFVGKLVGHVTTH